MARKKKKTSKKAKTKSPRWLERRRKAEEAATREAAAESRSRTGGYDDSEPYETEGGEYLLTQPGRNVKGGDKVERGKLLGDTEQGIALGYDFGKESPRSRKYAERTRELEREKDERLRILQERQFQKEQEEVELALQRERKERAQRKRSVLKDMDRTERLDKEWEEGKVLREKALWYTRQRAREEKEKAEEKKAKAKEKEEFEAAMKE